MNTGEVGEEQPVRKALRTRASCLAYKGPLTEPGSRSSSYCESSSSSSDGEESTSSGGEDE